MVTYSLVKATPIQQAKFQELVDEETLLDSYIVYKQKDMSIGVVWQGRHGWNSVPFVSDIGHEGFDTKEEAAEDVLSIFNEWYK